MRRSSAPSQLGGAAKRPRFNSPFLVPSQKINQTERSPSDVLNLINTSAERSVEKSPVLVGDTNVKDSADGHINPNPRDNISTTVCSRISNVPITEFNSSIAKENQLCEGGTLSMTSYATTKNLNNEREPQTAGSETQKCYKPTFKAFKSPSLNKNSAVKSGFSCPVKLPTLNDATNVDHHDIADVAAGPKCNYYNVMWCKLSKKKHKKWEGDAILVTKGRTVSLVDTDGKEIGRGSGYKIKELETLEEGHTLAVGGKEIEVMSLLSEEDYRSGKCFTGGGAPIAVNQPSQVLKTMSSGVSKPFAKPLKEGQNIQAPAPTLVVKPRYDVDAPDSLVLPRPSQSHQWEHDKSKACIVDVVVDPYVSQHLRPHQRSGVVFLYECVMGMKNYKGHGAILADEMGLGKTLQCISLIWTLLKQGPYGGKSVVKKVLIITPGSLVKNWLKEFKKWLGTERLRVFAVSQDNKIQDFIDSTIHPVLIISYEMFMRTVDSIRNVNFDMIICDEGHRLKNTTIKTTTLVNSLPSRRRIILTGTPVQNDLQELYSIVDFCNPGILGTASAFRHVYEEPILASRRPGADDDVKTLGETRAAELNRTTAMFILRRTSDINNRYLPPKVDLVLFCQASSLQLQLYKKLLTSCVVRSCLYTRDMAQHLTCISALRKLCNHPSLLYNTAKRVYDKQDQDNIQDNSDLELYQGLYETYPLGYNPEDVDIEQAGKLSVLAGLLASFHTAIPQERVVLVSNYTQTLDGLERLCKAYNYQTLRLDGQTPTGKRQQIVDRFNSEYSKDFVFLLSSKAGGIGLNLIGASRLILYDIDWNPANDLQAMARVWRDGQRRVVYIYRLLTTGSIEEKIYQRQITKQGLSGIVVDSKASSTSNQVQFSQEDLRDLFKLVETDKCSTHDMLDCHCQDPDRQQGDNLEMEQPSRDCQIGHTAKKNQKNLCMDELFQWHHISGPSPTLHVDPVLEETDLQKVNFVFYCQSNAT